MSSTWIPATGIALIIAVAAFLLSKWFEKKNYAQQLELLERKKERLKANAEALAQEQDSK